MIWKTAKSTDVKRCHNPYPNRAGMLRPDGRVRAVVATAGLAMARTLDGAEGRDGPSAAHRRGRSQGRREVGLQVLEVLEADRDAEEARSDAGVEQFGLGRLAMRCRRRMDHHRMDAPQRGG